jgi:hypothetical protein
MSQAVVNFHLATRDHGGDSCTENKIQQNKTTKPQNETTKLKHQTKQKNYKQKLNDKTKQQN